MPSNVGPEHLDPRSFQRFLNDDTVGLRQKCQFVRTAREESPDTAALVDLTLVRMITGLRTKLREAQAVQGQLEQIQQELDNAYRRLTAPPLHPATFLECRTIGGERTALVHYNSSPRFVTLDDGFDGNGVAAGDAVLLSGDLNLLVGKLDDSPLNCGETATFERYTDDGRLVLSRRDEEVIVTAGAGLEGVTLVRGDAVRWSPSAWLAYEKVERSRGDQFFLDEEIAETFDDIGGLDEQVDALKNLVLLHLQHGEVTQRYGLPPERAALLEGPPGTGKTMLVKALVNFLRELSPGKNARFICIKPGELGSMWYSRTEAKIREVFRVAREAAEADPTRPVVMFFDELDWIASSRGHNVHRVDDRAVDALAVELDGLRSRGNVLVLAATNRMDVLDPALIRPGRFGDAPIKVGRPRRAAAGAILSKYLRDDMPYAPVPGANGGRSNGGRAKSAGANGDRARDGRSAGRRSTGARVARARGCSNGGAREEIVEATVSRLYAPNGEGDVAAITFRDGSRRVVRLQDVMSGAVLAKIARGAARRACLREIETGAGGIELADVLAVIDGEIDAAARVLTPRNCALHLDDLPQDVDVVKVEPILRKRPNVHRFMRVV
jgi:proteasome-associated ATPase